MKKGYINTVMLSLLAARRVSASKQLNKAEALNKDTFRATHGVGFTLIELLVVVLIIGVLSAIAIPMYQGVVDKSHWSTMLPGAKAIKDAEEAIKMTNGSYTDNMANLDVTMNNADLTFALVTPNNTADPNVIRVTNSKLDNVRLASYLDDSPMFAGQLHCEAKTGDERAERLCGKLLMGQELTSIDGYVGYLLDQEIDQASCDNASRSWSSSKTKCYRTTADRCEALGMGVVSGMEDQCGYMNGTSGKNVGEEGICLTTEGASSYACGSVTYSNGGKCIAKGSAWVACYGAKIKEEGICDSRESSGEGCRSANIYEGGTCLGVCVMANIYQGGVCQGPCYDSTYNGGVCVGKNENDCASGRYTNGSICYALNDKACRVKYGHYDWDVSAQYDSTSCCCGAYCPSTAPSCASRGVTCDPKYMK